MKFVESKYRLNTTGSWIRIPRTLIGIGIILFLFGCSPNSEVPVSIPTRYPTPTTTTMPLDLPGQGVTNLPEPVADICSPLQDIPLSDLDEYVSNPFSPSLIADARDGGHHGVDFAYYTHPLTGKPMSGSDLYAVFPGKVASNSKDRNPYGNLVIIETPLSNLPAVWGTLFAEYPQPTPAAVEGHLTCPADYQVNPLWVAKSPSIYVLLAHMEEPTTLAIGESVGCGQKIGTVGNSGSSGNPHLHLEIRYGPGNATFESLAHYSNDASSQEMAAYCTWRVSGIFQLIDPMDVFHRFVK